MREIPTVAPRRGDADYEAFRRILGDLASDPNERSAPLARFIMTRPFDVAFGAVKDVAEGSGVSTAAVVRFSQRMGFSGFAEMREFIRDAFRAYAP